MLIIGEKKLTLFWEEYHEAKVPLKRWQNIVGTSYWNNFLDVRQSFRSVDYYKGAVIFDVGGNKYRLIATIDYQRYVVSVECLLTHLQYSTNKWKRDYES